MQWKTIIKEIAENSRIKNKKTKIPEKCFEIIPGTHL